MDERLDPRLFQSVILVDRVGTGGCGFLYDGMAYRFAPGQGELPLNRLAAEYILDRSEQGLVDTADGERVCRYAIKGTPEAELPIELATPPAPDPIITQSARAMQRAQRDHVGASGATVGAVASARR